MKRRIVQHGSSSLTITLPVKWVKRYNLKKGDDLFVDEQGPLLSINCTGDTSPQTKVITSSEEGIFTKNDLSHLYQLGYDDIEIRQVDNKTLEEIRRRLPECIGFELIDQGKNSVHIRSIATTIESEFDTLLRKSFQITNEMANELLEALAKQEYSELQRIRTLETLNNRFTDVCIRILNKKGYSRQNRTMQMYEIVKSIERIADEFKYICDIYLGHKGKIDPHYLALFSKVISYYLDFYKIFCKYDTRIKERIFLSRKAIENDLLEALERSKGKDSVFLHHVLSLLRKSYEGAGAYFSLIV